MGREKIKIPADTPSKALIITYFIFRSEKIKICGKERLVLQEHIRYTNSTKISTHIVDSATIFTIISSIPKRTLQRNASKNSNFALQSKSL